jgi:hypothetical protein
VVQEAGTDRAQVLWFPVVSALLSGKRFLPHTSPSAKSI